MATLEAIQARIKKLEAQAQALMIKKTSGVIKDIQDLMTRYDITIEDVAGFNGKASRKTKAIKATKARSSDKATSAKYADPKTGATWSGRGRAPAWIASARNRDVFLVDGGASTARKTVSAASKKATRKGPQPALYRDPVSGQTWSGFGRAPGWIATARDRSAFLIDGSGAAQERGETKAVPKKRAAAKKSGAKAPAATKQAKPAVKPAAKKKAKAGARKVARTTTANGAHATRARTGRKPRVAAQSVAPASAATVPGNETSDVAVIQ